MDIACSFDDMLKSAVYVTEKDPLHTCSLSCRNPHGSVTVEEFRELQSVGAPVRHVDEVNVYNVTMILNKRCWLIVICWLCYSAAMARILTSIPVHWFALLKA